MLWSHISLLSVAVTTASAYLLIERREDLLDQYDYVIIGGGLSGLVVANRLTEDLATTVLVIEAGELDKHEDSIYVPGDVGATLGTSYDWQVPTVPQDVLVNGNITIPLGKVVGGSSALNGMLFHRGSPADYDLWEALGNEGWGWEGLLPYFIKSETFTPPSDELVSEFGITYDESVHGFNGSVHASYPPFIYNQTKNFIKAMNQLGVQTSNDQASSAVGVFYLPNSLNPITMTRSFTRPDDHDVAVERANYHLLAGNQVTKILTEDAVAYGVEYSAGSNQPRYIVNATVEVVVAAGAVHTPQLLQLSGIGPRTLLEELGVEVVSDLPGVGSNFQDHPSLIVPYSFTGLAFSPQNLTSNATLAAYYRELYNLSKTGPYTVSAGNALAFISTNSFTNKTSELVAEGRNQNETYLSPGADPGVTAGYKKQRDLLLDIWGSSDAATIEYSVGSAGPLVISLSHALSRGDIRASSLDPFSPPSVDWRAFENPLDMELMIDAFRAGRRLMQTPAMTELGAIEATTGNLTTDEQIVDYLKKTMSPSFSHVCCTSPMMPKEIGGVVDEELRVFGVSGLRVIDAGVVPVVPAAHLQATIYAVAEKAADLIKSSR
ncbi:GMC oxidoreductase [Morchella conica CCBAS932]|uniref:GMC oxidoreductase n=1 Tax=Morchella conica CCBAS932 TaxID=1392247 RepID=A0A3N4L3A0_9PEZI|nr:GMC oxidoreductase [Morchella conica CCBAS932]